MKMDTKYNRIEWNLMCFHCYSECSQQQTKCQQYLRCWLTLYTLAGQHQIWFVALFFFSISQAYISVAHHRPIGTVIVVVVLFGRFSSPLSLSSLIFVSWQNWFLLQFRCWCFFCVSAMLVLALWWMEFSVRLHYALCRYCWRWRLSKCIGAQ